MKEIEIRDSDFMTKVDKVVLTNEVFSVVIARSFRKCSAIVRVIERLGPKKKPGLRFMCDSLYIGGDMLGALALPFANGYSATVEELGDKYIVHFSPRSNKKDAS
jgi:hypothetical protein